MVGQSSAELLRLFAEACETLSHRGRSSLTVLSGAVNDLAAGHQLEVGEVLDAVSSADELTGTFDSLRALGRCGESLEGEGAEERVRAELMRVLAAVKR